MEMSVKAALRDDFIRVEALQKFMLTRNRCLSRFFVRTLTDNQLTKQHAHACFHDLVISRRTFINVGSACWIDDSTDRLHGIHLAKLSLTTGQRNLLF